MAKLTNILWILLALIIQSGVVGAIISITSNLNSLVALYIGIIIGVTLIISILVILDKYTPMSFFIQIKADLWIIILSAIGVLLSSQDLGATRFFPGWLVVGIILLVISFVCLVIKRKKEQGKG